MLEKINKFFMNPATAIVKIHRHWDLKWMPDSMFLNLYYKAIFGEDLNLKNPITFNEKLQWLKLYDRRSEYTIMADKYAVKQYVADKIGSEYIIPTLGVWNHFDDIDFEKLPNQFVLKCTHDSGGLVICRDKSKLDLKAARKKIETCLKRNYFWQAREWPYKHIKPQVLAEMYMEDESEKELKDYKVFNFLGEPKLIQVDFDRFVGHKRNLYTPTWKLINAEIGYPSDKTHEIARPEKLEEMLEMASKLSIGMPHIRTDFYSIRDRIYFGELTLYHAGGFAQFKPKEFGEKLGKWICIDEVRGGGNSIQR